MIRAGNIEKELSDPKLKTSACKSADKLRNMIVSQLQCEICTRRIEDFPRWNSFPAWYKLQICQEIVKLESNDYLTNEQIKAKYPKPKKSGELNAVDQRPFTNEEISAYLLTPDRLRPPYGPSFFSEPVSKRSPGRNESIDARKKITAHMKSDPDLAKQVNCLLLRAKKFSLKVPEIREIRRVISSKVFGSEMRSRKDVGEWLRNHYEKLHRQNFPIRKFKTPCQ